MRRFDLLLQVLITRWWRPVAWPKYWWRSSQAMELPPPVLFLFSNFEMSSTVWPSTIPDSWIAMCHDVYRLPITCGSITLCYNTFICIQSSTFQVVCCRLRQGGCVVLGSRARVWVCNEQLLWVHGEAACKVPCVRLIPQLMHVNDIVCLLWAAVFTFNPDLLISINELLISIIHLLISIHELLISINDLLISINDLLISINELLISINTSASTVFIDINNSFIDINKGIIDINN